MGEMIALIARADRLTQKLRDRFHLRDCAQMLVDQTGHELWTVAGVPATARLLAEVTIVGDRTLQRADFSLELRMRKHHPHERHR
jgi:hypothetical protein